MKNVGTNKEKIGVIFIVVFTANFQALSGPGFLKKRQNRPE